MSLVVALGIEPGPSNNVLLASESSLQPLKCTENERGLFSALQAQFHTSLQCVGHHRANVTTKDRGSVPTSSKLSMFGW